MERKRKLLQVYQKDIVQDLDPNFILDSLYTKKAITNDEFGRIYDITDRADRTRYLLSLIQNSPNHSFEAFVDSLAKDYSWLYEKLNNTCNMNDSGINESFEDCLSRGDVPRLPDYYVQRLPLEEELALKLKGLPRHKILVLHGMSGCGKSSVVIGTLRHNPTLVTESFTGVLFWLNLANAKTDDDIITQQLKLYRKTSQYRRRDSLYMNSSISMSSIGSNTDSQSLSSNDWCWKELRDKLKSIFQEANLKDSLLILDEVNEKKFVEAFDIGCKILITTRDSDVVDKLQPQIIKVTNSFEEDESLQLFASCLDVNVSQLPFTSKAKKLHAICKGSPFHIALIGAQLAENRERLLNDSKRWDYYIKKLSKKDFISNFLRIRETDPMKPIEMCINSLQPNILNLFNMLAVLPDNVKVTANILKVLWNKPITEVESIMKQLRSKSLINEYYTQEQKNYVYEVHDLIMNYLRSNLNSDEISKLHMGFIKNYGYNNEDILPVEIPDDGYIAYYIGYHIDRASGLNKHKYFNKLFLNLNFLGNKVRLTGPADVKMDFQKYGNSICADKMDEELVRSITEFLSKHGNDLYRYPSTDIVQSILQHETKGVLYQRAHQLAQNGCQNKQLYFEFLHEQNVDDTEKVKHSMDIDVKENLTSVGFLYDYILVGTNKGTIKIYYVATNKLRKELTHSTYPIKSVAACPKQPIKVAALNSHGELHLWFLDDLEVVYDSDHTIEEEHETPASEGDENEYENSFSDSHICIPPKMGEFLTFSWANYEENLVTHTSKMVVIYGPEGIPIQVIDSFDKETEIMCCIFSHDDSIIITGYCLKNSYFIDIINWKKQEKLTTFQENGPILNIICLPASAITKHSILVITETEVRQHEWKIFQNSCSLYKSKNIVSTDQVKENVKFISAVVNKAGSILFVSTNDSRIICGCLKTNGHFDLDNIRGDVVSMAVTEMASDELISMCDVLLTGTGCVENSVKLWYFDTAFVSQATNKHRKVRLTARFDVNFTSPLSPKPSSGYETPPSDNQSTPKRHQSFMTQREHKPLTMKSLSLDRHSLKPLNLKGISNGVDETGIQPLLAIVDDRNNIQILRGRKVLTEISIDPIDKITAVRISPCNQFIVYGLHTGKVEQFIVRTKETNTLMDIYSRIQYLKFVNPNLLIVSGTNRCIMAYRFNQEGNWKLIMLQKGNCHLGSQEILNDIKGNKKKSGSLSSSESETSIDSRDRIFSSNDGKGRLSKGSSLVQCFWVETVGMLSIEDNATIKLWDNDLKLITVLNGRQTDVFINCAAFQNNTLVICDDYGKFQTFDIRRESNNILLHTIQEYKLNNKITSCDLTNDGHIVAMGLDSGFVVVWNIPAKIQLSYLKHHKSPVQACVFSPVPDKLFRSNSTAASPVVNHTFHYPNNNDHSEDEEPPLVLVTMASEILWWNISYLMKMRSNKNKHLRYRGRNVLMNTPVNSPIESRTEMTAALDNLDLNNSKYFFGNGWNRNDSWESLWKRKTYKEGSKKKEILACIKLSGLNAKKLCVDDKFSCFVTVDNSGYIHIMNVMKTNNP